MYELIKTKQEKCLLMVTSKGYVKRVELDAYKRAIGKSKIKKVDPNNKKKKRLSGMAFIKIDAGDKLISVCSVQ